jgi:hypothetical protein
VDGLNVVVGQTIAILYCRTPMQLFESVALMVKENGLLLVVVGVPLIVPFVLSVSPGGKAPLETLKV